ncbi:MAG TPA: hypothetical protein VN820_04270 [Acidimicrobiales bacterium]|nr:hypothetical protein [Acidimicrobiales bacterium]
MDDPDPLQAARAIRRAMLGDAYVDSQSTDPDPDSAAAEFQDGPRSMGAVTASVWEDFDRSEPGADFTRIFPFVDNS